MIRSRGHILPASNEIAGNDDENVWSRSDIYLETTSFVIDEIDVDKTNPSGFRNCF